MTHSQAKPLSSQTHTAKPLSSASSTFVFLGTLDRLETHGHMQQPPISTDHISFSPLHPLFLFFTLFRYTRMSDQQLLNKNTAACVLCIFTPDPIQYGHLSKTKHLVLDTYPNHIMFS